MTVHRLAPIWLTPQLSRRAPVPLPAAVWMFGAGLMGWLGLQKRKMAA